MNYKYHLYCGHCARIYRRDGLQVFTEMDNPKCPVCGKMLRKGPRKKVFVQRVVLEE